MVRDSRDWAYLAIESSIHVLQFPTLQSLTGIAHDSEKRSDCQKVIKS